MASSNIESLLERANTSPDNDTSVVVAERAFMNAEDCAAFFEKVKASLFRIEEWNKNSTSDYELFDETGRVVDSGLITVGTSVRIKVHGTGKHDWVRVVEILDGAGEVVLKVKPGIDPTNRSGDGSISHFFGPAAENNFCIARRDGAISFSVIGLNQVQNTEFSDGVVESARNAAVANIGYYTGLQGAVWKQFSSNFLRTDEEKND
jgi:hypothetical protein